MVWGIERAKSLRRRQSLNPLFIPGAGRNDFRFIAIDQWEAEGGAPCSARVIGIGLNNRLETIVRAVKIAKIGERFAECDLGVRVRWVQC